ncbi:MAG: hypothetical protein EZS28_030927, partial [Streblomastix strix]
MKSPWTPERMSRLPNGLRIFIHDPIITSSSYSSSQSQTQQMLPPSF